MNTVDEIKARLDTLAYIQQYVPLKKAGKNWKGICPFHSEKTPSFTVDAERGTWRCYGACTEGGDVIAFAMKRNGWSFGETLVELGRLTGVEVKRHSPASAAQEARLDNLRGLMKAAAEYYQSQLPADHAFMAARGIDEVSTKLYGLGLSPEGFQNLVTHLHELGYTDEALVEAGVVAKTDKGRIYDRLRHRIIFPIWDERGRVVALAGRAINADDNPKYMNTAESPLFAKSKLLYGFHLARTAIRDTGIAVVVEGYMDVISAHQAGFANVVAQMGTALTDQQVALLPQDTTIVLALDGDAAGQEATNRQLERLVRLHRDLRILALPEGNDPDDIIRRDPDEWARLVDEAPPVGEYIIDQYTHDVSSRMSIEDRWARAKAAIPLLVFCEVDVIRREYIQRLALKLHFKPESLLAVAPESPRSLTQFQDAPPPPAEPSNPVELALICTLVHRPALYDEMVQALDKLGVPPLEPTDFEDVRAQIILRAFLDARRERPGDIKGHLASTLEGELFDQITDESVVTKRRFMQFVARQRGQSIQNEIEGMDASAGLADIMARTKQRTALQQWERELQNIRH